ncbi:MAG: DUF5110 domain-containing protein [Lachnospiraceae bacterium]|nr:DUF5110 domain-containing protein [Lachnospiraceae bacterium]
MGKLFGFNAVPLADESAVIQGDKYRITVLTSRMLRLEYSEDGIFEDRATQIVLNRRFPVPQFRVIKKEEGFELVTDSLLLSYNGKEFSSSGLSIQVNGNLSAYRSTWFYGEEYKDLKGTARTLDEADGEVELDRGLLSYYGFSLIDDSKSTIIREDGWVEPRKKGCKDIYFLGYGRDYLGCLKDFYKLSGPTPMIPRYALGNWWSRFYWYTEKEYKELYTRFMKEDIPFSVAVLDMCWHITDVDPKYGSGWTGYTWNKELLPDPEGFMKWLHENNMRITLNVHPADGVRGFEEMYADMAAELGVDADREDKINFDVADRSFLESYFRNIYHRNEKRGVDFWWIDWQQQGGSKVEGIDAQWMLNHYHYLDNGREGKKPLILSRYAGLGSHRYPVGFSGDTFATWDSLDFQPYFTANASNAGYGWWSHDIGGHMHGTRSDEMAMRWLQFGVFSPIMRIHSSDNPFNTKEPWKYNAIVEEAMKKFLRLRHQMIPYLYTMNYSFHVNGEPVIQPMYYRNPEDLAAYDVKNQYYFGSGIIVCPITKPLNSRTGLGEVRVWLPEGRYFDFFNNRSYVGGHNINMYRDVSTIPVLVKAGSIIPLQMSSAVSNCTDNPKDMELRIYAGDSGSFTMYEDGDGSGLGADAENNAGAYSAFTRYDFEWGSKSVFTVNAVTGENPAIPEKRNYIFKFEGFNKTDSVMIEYDGSDKTAEYKYDEKKHELIVEAVNIDTSKLLKITVETDGEIAENNYVEECFRFLDRSQIEFDLKSSIFRIINSGKPRMEIIRGLTAMKLEEELMGALMEIITAD